MTNTSSLVLVGAGTNRTISISSSGFGGLFTLVNSSKLTLARNITLQGNSVTTAKLVISSGQLLMEDTVTITGNSGGGVAVEGGTFTMKGGTISGNSDSQGGGVYVGSGIFTKTGGTIYGSDAAESLRNTSTSANGQAVYCSNGRYRNTTADEDVNLDSATTDNWGE